MAPPRQKLKILFIGNSYTYFNDLPEILKQLVRAAGQPTLETKVVTLDGATLEKHWQEGTALKALQTEKWDLVVLQEQSLRPLEDPAAMYKYARLFDREITKTGGKTVFFLTWARQDRPQTQAALTDAYLNIAKELKAIVVPAGIAWQKILTTKPQVQLYADDGSHPNLLGSYLTACVFLATFYGVDPHDLTIDKIKESAWKNSPELTFIQRVAWETVQKSRNLP